MATILLSIKPEYIERILDGSKEYEFRKKLPHKEVNKVVMYSTDPDQCVVGEFEVIETISMKPTPMWEHTKLKAGISRSKYRNYFHGCETAYAYRIGKVTQYEERKKLQDYNISQAPQSFIYLD